MRLVDQEKELLTPTGILSFTSLPTAAFKAFRLRSPNNDSGAGRSSPVVVSWCSGPLAALVGAIRSESDGTNDEGIAAAESSVLARLWEAAPESFAPDVGCDTALVGLEVIGERLSNIAGASRGRNIALFSAVFAARVVCGPLSCSTWRSASTGGFFWYRNKW